MRYMAAGGDWISAESLQAAVMAAEAESEKQLRVGAKVVEADHSRENYYLEVFDNGVVVEYWFDI